MKNVPTNGFCNQVYRLTNTGAIIYQLCILPNLFGHRWSTLEETSVDKREKATESPKSTEVDITCSSTLRFKCASQPLYVTCGQSTRFLCD